MQPAAVLHADAELWATGYVRAALATRAEPYAADVRVANTKTDTAVRQVVIRRDGGPQDGLFDIARLTVRVWAGTEQEAADLARLVRALLVAAPGNGPCVGAQSPTGPQGVPDAAGPQKFFTVETKLRGVNLWPTS